MKGKRKRHDPAYKARVAFEAIKGDKTAQKIAKEYDVHPVQVSEWKNRLAAELPDIFKTIRGKSTEEQFEKEREKLQAKIGELTIQIDYLTKKSKQLGL